MDNFQEAWQQLEQSITSDQNVSVLSLAVYLVLGGIIALYLRLLYKHFGATASDADSITRTFPLLVIVTTAVIAVVKSSLALSLGLVGALSIVRFRAAIKEPEELVYLFLCIAVGLSLGAEQPLLACSLVAVSSIFIVVMHVSGRKKRQQRLMLTISGDVSTKFADSRSGVFAVLDELSKQYSLQRYDVDQGRGQVRVILPPRSTTQTAELITQLQQKLPDCDLSYVNLNSNL